MESRDFRFSGGEAWGGGVVGARILDLVVGRGGRGGLEGF